MGEVFKLNHCYNMDCLPAMELFPDNYFDLAVVDGATKRIVLCKERVPRTGKAARRNKAGKPVRWKRNNAAVRRNVRRASGLGKRGRAVPHCCYKDASAEHEASWKRYGHQGLSD